MRRPGRRAGRLPDRARPSTRSHRSAGRRRPAPTCLASYGYRFRRRVGSWSTTFAIEILFDPAAVQHAIEPQHGLCLLGEDLVHGREDFRAVPLLAGQWFAAFRSAGKSEPGPITRTPRATCSIRSAMPTRAAGAVPGCGESSGPGCLAGDRRICPCGIILTLDIECQHQIAGAHRPAVKPALPLDA